MKLVRRRWAITSGGGVGAVSRMASTAESALLKHVKKHLEGVGGAIASSNFESARLYMGAVERSADLIEIARILRIAADGALPAASKTSAGLSLSIGAMTLFTWRRLLFPAEEMLCLSGPISPWGVCHLDQAVPLEPDSSSTVHFQPTPESVYSALKRFKRFGYGLKAIIHSHPGEGPSATIPSSTDRQTLEGLERSYRAIGMIVTGDGYLRAFSDALNFELKIYGEGIEVIDEKQKLFQLTATDGSSIG